MRGAPLLIVLVLGIAGCRDDGGGGGWFSQGAQAESIPTGDAVLGPSGRLRFELTSGVYRRWTQAQRALGKSEVARSVARLGRRALTQQELDDAVARVERDATARSAIEGAGMTPREYVYATVALEQAMAVASGKLTPLERDVPAQNVEVVGQYRDEILDAGIIGDTTYLEPPVLAEPDTFGLVSPELPSSPALPSSARRPGDTLRDPAAAPPVTPPRVTATPTIPPATAPVPTAPIPATTRTDPASPQPRPATSRPTPSPAPRPAVPDPVLPQRDTSSGPAPSRTPAPSAIPPSPAVPTPSVPPVDTASGRLGLTNGIGG